MTGFGKHRLCTKFEVASFSNLCKYWRGPPNFGELP